MKHNSNNNYSKVVSKDDRMSTIEQCFELLHKYNVSGGLIYHSAGVAEFAVRFAKQIGLDGDVVYLIMRAGLLHDIGKEKEDAYPNVGHARAGHDIMVNEGYDALAGIVDKHESNTVFDEGRQLEALPEKPAQLLPS